MWPTKLEVAGDGSYRTRRGHGRGESTILFNTNFEGGSLGKIEILAPGRFRCSVQGQYDEQGPKPAGELVLLSHGRGDRT